jgi:hypothetical protein
MEYVGVTSIPLRGRIRCSDLSHKQKKNAASNVLEAAQGIGFIENS